MNEGGDQDLHQWNALGSDTLHEKIFVSVRLRPLNDKEYQSNDFADWESIDNTTILFKNSLGERSMYPNAYHFDRVFDYDDSTRKVYEEAAKEIALSVLNGINSSIFAYGQTSSGKTFTMSEITQYAVADIYDYLEKHKEREFLLKFSAIEIYDEHVRDLLSTDATPLRLLDDPERGTVVEKLIEEVLPNKSHLLELIAICEAQRQTGANNLNETSSRSHQILRLTIESSASRFGGGNSSILAAHVNFVDLAGSERTSQTLATGTRLKEGSHINRSLLTLGKVIRTLSKGKNGHIPYRDSKLTRILQNSLGGNARTAIICTMSPAHSHLEQSRNTLLFACCAKEVTTSARVNVVMSDKALVKQLRKELAKLESDLKNIFKFPYKGGDTAAVLRDKELQIEKMDKEIKELSRQRDLAQTKVEELLKSTQKKQVSEPQHDGFNHQQSESWDKLSWFDDSSEVSDGSDYRRLDADLETSETFQYLDQQDNFHLTKPRSDLLEHIDLLPNESFLQPQDDTSLVSTPDDSSEIWEEMGYNVRGRIDEDIEDNWKEVRCIEVEDGKISKKTETSDRVKTFPQEKVVQDEEETKKVLHRKEYAVLSNEIENAEVKKKEKERSKKEEKTMHRIDPSYVAQVTEKNEEREPHHYEFEHDILVQRIQELQRTINMLVNHNQLGNISPYSTDSDKSSSRGSNFSRSRSCKAVLTSQSANITNEKVVLHYRDISFCGFDEEMNPERPKDLPRGSDHVAIGNGKLLRFGLPIPSIRNAIMNEMEWDVKNSNVSGASSIYSSVVGTNGDAQHESDRPMGNETDDHSVKHDSEPTESASSVCTRDSGVCPLRVRDCISEGAMSTVQSPLNWFEEFETQRFKIIELWHACHIPLVHRTYFYLLFKGDISDKVYIEVELRRLTFIKSRFDQGQKIVMDGEVFTTSSSLRALHQERDMLMKQMNRKIPVQRRETIFQKWGIQMNSKLRRLQLVSRLWTDTKDMQHIKESATLVAKLVGFIDEGQVPKEIFVGPSITTKTQNRRSHGWKSSMSMVS